MNPYYILCAVGLTLSFAYLAMVLTNVTTWQQVVQVASQVIK